MMNNAVKKDFVLLQGSGMAKGMVTPDIPANVPQLGGFLGAISGIPIYADIKGLMALFGIPGEALSSDVLKGFLNRLAFKPGKKKVGVQSDVMAAVLEKEDGEINFAFHIANSFHNAGYEQNIRGYHPIRSLYQDQVRFNIRPKDISLVEPNHRGTMPKTDMQEANYSNSTTWNTKIGFSGDVGISGKTPSVKFGISGEFSFSFAVTAGTSMKDFDMAKVSEDETKTIGWISRMRNIYLAGSNQPTGHGYNPDDPYSLVVNGAFTKWFNDPALAAKSDLDLEFLAAYKSVDPDIRNKVVVFEFSTIQRLIHAEIVGRWGIPRLEVGGAAAVIPYYVYNTGVIEIDMRNRRMEVKEKSCKGYNLKQQAGQQHLLSKQIV